MKYELTLNGLPETIEILAPAPACRFRLGETEPRHADVETPEPGVYSVLMNGRGYEARIEPHPNAMVVVIDGFRFEIGVRDPRRLSRGAGARGREGVEIVAAPMPGRIVRVLASLGDAVEEGQGLVVVEAMKMQNELKATRAGRVTALSATVGAAVTAGETLAIIE
jgi:biotin carboxyl carrier protein